MANAEGVVLAFTALGKAGYATVAAQLGHSGAAPGQNLVRIGLVADIPDQAVSRRVEDRSAGRSSVSTVPEVGRQVTTGFRDRLNKESSQFFSQLWQLLAIEFAQLRRIADGVEQRI